MQVFVLQAYRFLLCLDLAVWRMSPASMWAALMGSSEHSEQRLAELHTAVLRDRRPELQLSLVQKRAWSSK